ncbi:MAG: hypothetical protein Q4B84_04465 [Clostridia bacterium]|nr:hypothetical protein [Clostridia bacterium]
MNNSNLDDLMNKISEKLNIDKNDLGKIENKKEINNILNKADPSDIEKAKKIISDKSALSKVLSTPAAKQILKKFLGGK